MRGLNVSRRSVVWGAAAAGVPGSAFARQLTLQAADATPAPASTFIPPGVPGSTPAPEAPPALTLEQLVQLELGQDDAQRMRVGVRVNGRGPFPFTVDTGADRSVISTELAAALALPEAGFARVNGIAGVRTAACAHVDRVEAGGVRLSRTRLPTLSRSGLGGLGLVGLDCLADQRMEIDFDRRVMELRRSRGLPHDPDEIVVRGKSRFGKLILVDSSARRQPIYVVLDSGAQNTLGNDALRTLLAERRRAAQQPELDRRVTLESATGQTVEGQSDEATELTLGGIVMRRVPVIYADLHTFHLYGLEREPALMLGMDVLRVFRRVWVDFARREVGFQLPRDSFTPLSMSVHT